MIISPIYLPMRKQRWSAFEINLTNLEAVPLRFRFTYTISKSAGGAYDLTAPLRDRVKFFNLAGIVESEANWVRVDGASPVGVTSIYRAGAEITVPPGITHAHQLRCFGHYNYSPGAVSALLAQPANVVRGHWDLSLPLVPKTARNPQPSPALDHPARVAVLVVFHGQHNGVTAYADEVPNVVPIPTLSGQAEHFIPPDQLPVAKRAASKRRSSQRRTR